MIFHCQPSMIFHCQRAPRSPGLDTGNMICYTKNTGWEQRVGRENPPDLTRGTEPAKMENVKQNNGLGKASEPPSTETPP